MSLTNRNAAGLQSSLLGRQKVPNFVDRVKGCWMGKSIGGTLGLPAEGRMERLFFSFYEPIPTVAPPNDDLELQLVWLELVERSGGMLTQSDFAKAWVDHIHYMWDEYGRCRWNLRRGVPVENVGTFENPFHAGMGSPIRSEIWACLFPGDPDSTAWYAALDASLDHGTEGIAGEVLFAVMQCLIAAGEDLGRSLARALSYLPVDCETSRAISVILECQRAGLSEWDCWERLIEIHGHENFTHAPLNVALTIWALCYGDGDFEKSILLAVNGGYDTDCTAATVGATLGFQLGIEGVPKRWIDPIGEDVFVGPGIIGISAPKTLTELSERVVALIGKLEKKSWSSESLYASPAEIDLDGLPGTLVINSFSGDSSLWANGELPLEVKKAGGAAWDWQVTTDEPREIICLARQGARLFIDGKLLIECSAEWPFVPATHRSAFGSRVQVNPGVGMHRVRLELNSCEPVQEVSVMLAYRNLHLAPWTALELPNAAILA